MATLTIGARNTRGIYKNVTMDIGRKVKIGIGYVDGTPQEQSILKTLQKLENAIIEGDEPNQDLRKRINKLPSRIQTKLISKQLITPKSEGITLEEVMTKFLAERLENGDPRTIRNYKSAIENGLLAFTDRSRMISAVDQSHLISFINDSSKKYRVSTVKNQIKRAKAMFVFAADENYIEESPFDTKKVRELCSQYTIKLEADREQTQVESMTNEEVARLLNCKKSDRSEIEDKEWNALVHMLRFGAGRVSSYLILRWRDIDFDKKTIQLRMKRTGGRTKFIKGDKRIETVPLFPEMINPLKELQKLQPIGTEYVLNRIGNLGQKPEFESTNAKGERVQQGRWETNLSTTFKKLLKRNGFKVWSQPFHAFRSYRGAELGIGGATEIELNAWIGNSAEIRKRHYGKFHMMDANRFNKSKNIFEP